VQVLRSVGADFVYYTKSAPTDLKNPLLNFLLLWHNSDLLEAIVQDEEQQHMQNEPLQTPITSTNALDIQKAAVVPPSQANRRKVFISYSRSDGQYLKELVTHLKPYIRSKAMEVWNDTMIDPGEDWNKQIEKALAGTRVAVLLVSAEFFASDYIYDNELMPLREASDAGEVTLLTVLVSPLTFKDTPLAGLQAVNDPKDPLSKMRTSERDELWVKVVKNIKRVLEIKS
jgi:hypothetical protein